MVRGERVFTRAGSYATRDLWLRGRVPVAWSRALSRVSTMMDSGVSIPLSLITSTVSVRVPGDETHALAIGVMQPQTKPRPSDCSAGPVAALVPRDPNGYRPGPNATVCLPTAIVPRSRASAGSASRLDDGAFGLRVAFAPSLRRAAGRPRPSGLRPTLFAGLSQFGPLPSRSRPPA